MSHEEEMSKTPDDESFPDLQWTEVQVPASPPSCNSTIRELKREDLLDTPKHEDYVHDQPRSPDLSEAVVESPNDDNGEIELVVHPISDSSEHLIESALEDVESFEVHSNQMDDSCDSNSAPLPLPSMAETTSLLTPISSSNPISLYPGCSIYQASNAYESCCCSSCLAYAPAHPGMGGYGPLDVAQYAIYPPPSTIPSSSSPPGSGIISYRGYPYDMNSVRQTEAAMEIMEASYMDRDSSLIDDVSITSKDSSKQSASRRTMKRGPKNKPLNEVAVNTMEKWYLAHIDHPYPSCQEKEDMARQGSITIAQVNSWFANRRNRSDNTKPKKNRKQLQIRLYQFAKDLEGATNGLIRAYDVARRLTLIMDEYLS